MDGSFHFEDKVIEYMISDKGGNTIRTVRGVEMMSRFIQYYFDKKPLDVIAVYDTYEQMTNITADYALKKFIELNVGRKI